MKIKSRAESSPAHIFINGRHFGKQNTAPRGTSLYVTLRHPAEKSSVSSIEIYTSDFKTSGLAWAEVQTCPLSEAGANTD